MMGSDYFGKEFEHFECMWFMFVNALFRAAAFFPIMPQTKLLNILEKQPRWDFCIVWMVSKHQTMSGAFKPPNFNPP